MEGRGPAAGMPRRPQPGRRARAHRFGFVLVLVLGYACFQVAAPDDAWVRFVTTLLGAGTLLAAVWAHALSAWLPARPRRRPCWWQPWRGCTRRHGLGAGPARGDRQRAARRHCAVGHRRGHRPERRTEQAVTLYTLSGVLAIYLLAGMFFSFLYGAINAVDDGNFFAEVGDAGRSDFLYFSYITLSTTGYGDLTPAPDVGRMLALAEALLGQIYLVTIVALIVANLRPRR
jgi:hypothetical protein